MTGMRNNTSMDRCPIQGVRSRLNSSIAPVTNAARAYPCHLGRSSRSPNLAKSKFAWDRAIGGRTLTGSLTEPPVTGRLRTRLETDGPIALKQDSALRCANYNRIGQTIRHLLLTFIIRAH